MPRLSSIVSIEFINFILFELPILTILYGATGDILSVLEIFLPDVGIVLINNLIPFLKHDKKNNDSKINFILLKKIGKTTLPNKYKIEPNRLKKLSKLITQY